MRRDYQHGDSLCYQAAAGLKLVTHPDRSIKFVQMATTNAAENLLGLTLDTGWKVTAQIAKPPGATGGFFSVCYRVERSGEEGFLKAFNFANFFLLANAHGASTSVVDVMSEMLAAYKYERDLSALCKSKNVTKVSFVRDAGEQTVSGYAIPMVPYLVFEVADGGDVRTQLSFATSVEVSWKLRSLHSVAVGLRQLHLIDVSHQDLKPSNVLLFSNESKIGDLGRSVCMTLQAPHDGQAFAGDLTYAPPEILYGAHDTDRRRRSFSSDCYLFGSLVVFYFSGLTMTALLRKHLPDDASWERHRGAYEDVSAYLANAFGKALDEFGTCVSDETLRRELKEIVAGFCNPDPSRRGYRGVPSGGSNDMERVVTRLDLLRSRAQRTLIS